MHTKYDVVVSGAGIAGLLLASELSKYKKVLLIDSKDDLQTSKYWVTLKSCIEQNSELLNLIESSFSQMNFTDVYQKSFELKGDYILWKTFELMDFLRQQLITNGGEIKFGQRFYGYRTHQKNIDVFVNEKSYSAKLLVDCMGYSSPLVLAKNMIDIKGYYILYGAKLRIKHPLDPVCLSNVTLDRKPKYLEVFPTSTNEAYTSLIYPTNKLTDSKGLAADFKFIVTKSYYSKYFEGEEVSKRLWGIVPVGKIKRLALDNIFFFGESAQANPAATGTCLTRILLNYKNVVRFLNDRIEKNELNERYLSKSPIVLNQFIRRLQLHAFNDILNWNSDTFSKFISIIDYVDHNLINKFLFGDLTTEDIFTKRRIAALLHPKNFFLAKPLLKSLSQ